VTPQTAHALARSLAHPRTRSLACSPSFRLASFNELDIELILVLLKISGHRLKSDDREVLDGVIVGITQRAQAAEAKPRVRFMLDSIADLKGNKKKLVKVE